MMTFPYQFRIKSAKQLFCALLFFIFVLIFPSTVEAGNITSYRDLLSDSAPAEYSNHTVTFTTEVSIPPGGYIRLTPESGQFTIPTTTFDYKNVELYVNAVQRTVSTTTTATTDGVSIAGGSSGNVEITLNSTSGIATNDIIQVLMGTHTTLSTSTDTGFLNSSAPGTKGMRIEVGGGSETGDVTALVAIIDSVKVGPIDTTEEIPPFRFNGAPSSTIAGTVTSAQISLETDEFATCRYSTASSTPFFSMGLQFDDVDVTLHTKVIAGIVNETTYTFYVRCIDDEGNFNTDDYVISFTVDPEPTGEPGDGDDNANGNGSGSGSGSSGSGAGSSSGNSGGSGSGGSGGGGGGGGGFETSTNNFPSGDAQVIINGRAFPRSEVFVLVDGALADTSDNTLSNGDFSIVLDSISRGTHTFGIYAVDDDGTKSSTFTTTFSVIGQLGSTLSNINLMPTITVSPDPVPNPGDFVTFSGFSIPDSSIDIETISTGLGATVRNFSATSDSSGVWSANVSTAGFARGTWKVRAKSTEIEGTDSTDFSAYTLYGIGEEAEGGNSSDLNRDGKVNITDFSILLFWWGGDGGTSDPPADINGNGKVSLEDFSIMLFNWTG